ncbi:hypothetical protein [Paenibacillus alvei]|uniref:hypothetical protein n=1 Tax=Paenibacillus alvei TaxID=44250 RepID=UPI0022812339|nr:hypothetical protein [Paenibacillus alvei]MCY7486040.1 hypothetical protein [Paenibacillus alvei]
MNEMQAIEATYFDSCDVSRVIKVKVNGRTETKREDAYKGLRCALSRSSSQTLTQDGARYVTVQKYTLYLNPTYDIIAGDELTITHEGQTFVMLAAVPFKYPSHQQVPLSAEGEA